MADWHIHVRRVRWRLLRPLTTGAGPAWRDVLELRLERPGRRGWGEAAPLPGLHRETLAEVEAALPLVAGELERLDAAKNPLAAAADLEARLESVGAPPSLRWAAAWALAEALGWREPRDLPSAPRTAGLLAGPPDTWTGQATAHPATCWKIKVSRHLLEEETAALNELRRAQGAAAELRLDANRAFTLEEARRLMRDCPDLAPRWIEEPLADAADLAAWLAEGGWPLALDENLVSGALPTEQVRSAAAWILKPHLLGLTRTLRHLRLAAELVRAESRAPVCVISSSFESPRGLAPLELLARLAPGRPAPGLGTRDWFEDEAESEAPWTRV